MGIQLDQTPERKKLTLRRESLRVLSAAELTLVVGGRGVTENTACTRQTQAQPTISEACAVRSDD